MLGTTYFPIAFLRHILLYKTVDPRSITGSAPTEDSKAAVRMSVAASPLLFSPSWLSDPLVIAEVEYDVGATDESVDEFNTDVIFNVVFSDNISV